MERYNHEFGFRVKVVEVAERQGQPNAPQPLVRPVIIDECDSCPWHDVCLEQVGESEPSVHVVSGRLGLREWNALRSVGVVTVKDLAGLSLDDPRLASYWPELEIKQSRAFGRLEDAITRAQMSVAGERVRATGGRTPEVPNADVEVDFDLEWDADGRLYLWGLLVTDGNGHRVESVYSWDPLDEGSEADLASVAIARLVSLREEAESSGQTFRVYHYSHPEISMVRSVIRRGGPHPRVANSPSTGSRRHVMPLTQTCARPLADGCSTTTPMTSWRPSLCVVGSNQSNGSFRTVRRMDDPQP